MSATTSESTHQNLDSRLPLRSVGRFDSQQYASDPKFKKYTQQVEKCLNSFDNVQEWADCIAFLKNLLKTLQVHMQFKEIPRNLIVAKRLAQCLNPALPTGVHQRALDVYAHILAVLGSEGLRRDLPLWSAGLFPFFEYAATSVKPALLNIYDTHYLPLQDGLRPIMKAFILSLLPGLEEETGEYFETVLGLLDKLSGAVSLAYFFQNIWLIMLTSPSARGTALNFLSRRLPKVNADDDISAIIGSDTGLMIRAFAAALEDDDLLVRRSSLDLLVSTLRLDSKTISTATMEDREILMKAASSVVLRRDLSLNRRLHTWLLGSSDNSSSQTEYYKKHSLDLLIATLKEEMLHPSPEYPFTRPFKIFISLLDKWEIGGPLTDAMVLDVFRAIKSHLHTTTSRSEDLVLTASSLYEGIEPHILWKQIFAAVVAEINGETNQHVHPQAIRLAKFVIENFHHDEEIETLHLPIVISGVAELLNIRSQDVPTSLSSVTTQEALDFLETTSTHLERFHFTTRPELPQQSNGVDASISSLKPFEFAHVYYGLVQTKLKDLPARSLTQPWATTFEDIASLSIACANHVLTDSSSTATRVFEHVLTFHAALVPSAGLRKGERTKLFWDPQKWLVSMRKVLCHSSIPFEIVDRVISLALTLHQANTFVPVLNLHDRDSISDVVHSLTARLRPQYAMYHVRAVRLIWEVEALDTHPHVESILAEELSKSHHQKLQEAYDAFGVLWRLTDDNQQPGFHLRVPMLILLGSLKDEDPNVRRIADTWMRCSLRSYLRILDPILFDLLDPTIYWKAATTVINGKELPSFTYEKPVDQRYIIHLIEILTAVSRFGGQSFAKILQSTQARRSLSNQVAERVQKVLALRSEASYLDVMIDLLLRFIQSEPRENIAPIVAPLNLRLQAVAVELLQNLVSRGEIDEVSLAAMEAAVVGKLYYCVHKKRLDIQNKLLHLLHSVISASVLMRTRSRRLAQRQDEASSSRRTSMEDEVSSYAVNPLLVQTLIDGITLVSNRSVYQHWLDFILMTVPQHQQALQAAIGPLNDSVCRQLRTALAEVLKISKRSRGDIDDVHVAVSDAEFLMYLNALERLILLGVTGSVSGESADDETEPLEKGSSEPGGIFGYVTTVFSSDNATSATEPLAVRSSRYHALRQGVGVLFSLWTSLVWSPPSQRASVDDSLGLIFAKVRTRCGRVFEQLFRAHTMEVIELVAEFWESQPNNTSAFELVDLLASNAQNVVHLLCENIASRISNAPSSRKPSSFHESPEKILYTFLEAYFRRLDIPAASQVWNRYMQFTKDAVASLRETKLYAYPTLRCMHALAEKVVQSGTFEDRRLRRDMQDAYSKLVDATIAFAGRDSASWLRRGPRDSLAINGRNSPLPRVASESRLNEKRPASPASIEPIKATSDDHSSQIVEYVATELLPNLKKFMLDNDRIINICTAAIYNLISPAIKNRQKPMDLERAVIDMMKEMSRFQFALKVWRAPVTEVLNDPRVFSSTPEAGEKWKPVVGALIDSDKAAFSELLGKIATAPSANIFTNREHEMLLQSISLRRLSYIILAGDKNHFLTQLPSVLEKLVDILRNVTSTVVQSEVYLCMRVLLCRLSPHNLTSFWPVLLTELYRIFDQILVSMPADGSEELTLILAVCKLLDLLLVLQTGEFQVHQWAFITDTVDAVYHPDGWTPDALMDRLAEVTAELMTSGQTDMINSANLTVEPPAIPSPMVTEMNKKRVPMLNGLSHIDSIRELIPFFSQVSISSYESIYASEGRIDWDCVELGLLDDIFDGLHS